MDAAFPAPSRPANDPPILQSSQLPETPHPHLSNIQCSPPLNSPASTGALVNMTNLGSSQENHVSTPPVSAEGM